MHYSKYIFIRSLIIKPSIFRLFSLTPMALATHHLFSVISGGHVEAKVSGCGRKHEVLPHECL